jgi:hypothetical protein
MRKSGVSAEGDVARQTVALVNLPNRRERELLERTWDQLDHAYLGRWIAELGL